MGVRSVLRRKDAHMNNNIIARTSISINASKTNVWNALVNPEAIKKYMFGTNVVSDWKEGGAIIWKGEWQVNRMRTKV